MSLWQTLVAALPAIIAALTAAYVAIKQRQNTKVIEAVHTLVNSNMGIQLRIASVALQRVADLTRDPVDAEAAVIAHKALTDHEAKQATVDAGVVTPIVPPVKPVQP